MTLKQIIEQWFWKTKEPTTHRNISLTRDTKKSANNLQFRLHHLTKRSKPMSDLPERIFIDPEDGERCSPYAAEKYGTAVEYIRADLAPASSEVPIPTVEDLAEIIYQEGPALLAKDEARYMASVVHKLLTPKGVKHG